MSTMSSPSESESAIVPAESVLEERLQGTFTSLDHGSLNPKDSETPSGQLATLECALKQREWLLSQKAQLTAQISTLESDFSQKLDSLPDHQVLDLYEELKEELLQRTVLTDSRELLLKDEHLNQTLITVTSAGQDENADPKLLEQKRELDALLHEVTQITVQLGLSQQQKDQTLAKVEAKRKENFESLQKSRELYKQVGRQKQEKDEEMKALLTDTSENSLYDQLQTKVDRLALANGVTQRLILGSGINWAEDETTSKLMISAGESVNT